MVAELVSIVLPVFNGERYLAQAIESVLGQTYRRFELLVVDDGSRDGSATVVRRFQEHDPDRVLLLTHPGRRNRGVAASRNLAVRRASGTYLAFLDQDDWWLPEKLERQVAFLERHPEVGLCYTRAQILRESGGARFIPGTDSLGDEPPTDCKSALYKVAAIELNYIFSAVMARTEEVRATGGFPEDMLFQSDDRVLVAKIAARRRLGMVPEVLCHFRAHGEHYTRDVLDAGIAPIVFFDLQLHVVRWLRSAGAWEWAHDISYFMLPRFYAEAVFRLRQMDLFMVWHGLFGWTRRRGRSLAAICRRCLMLRLLWRWRDPLRAHLLLQRNFPPPACVPDDQPLVTVVIPAYNAEKFLAPALESVLGQTYRRFEVLLVDDGSTDGTPRIAERYAAEHPERLRVLRHPGGANRGVAASRNLALSLARGAFVAFLDADDAWLPEKLELQVRTMLDRPELGLCYTDATIIREDDGHRWLPGVTVLGDEPRPALQDNLVGIVTIAINYIFSTVMVRTEVVRAVGGFVERLPFQSEDRIMVAAVSATHLVGRLPRVLAHYRAHGESYSASVVKAKTASIIVFDLQVRVICWLLTAGLRDTAVNLAARLIPGSLLRSLPRLRRTTLGPWLRSAAVLALRMPHLPLIVLFFHISERARRWRSRE